MQPDQNHPATTETTETTGTTEPSTGSVDLPEPAARPLDTAPAPPSEAESYLDLARDGRGRGRHYLIGMLIIVFVSPFAALVAFAVADALLPSWAPSGTAGLIASLPEFAIVLLVVVGVHRRGWRSVITGRSRITSRNILRPALLFALLSMATYIPDVLLDPSGLRFGVSSWSMFAATVFVAVLLVPFQASTEEMISRGYLIQWVSLATRRRWVLATISGLHFGWWHLPIFSLSQLNAIDVLSVLMTYSVPAFAFAWVSITTGSIEAAIGAHIANNLLVIIVIGQANGTAQPLISDTSPDLLLGLVSNLLLSLLFARIVTGRSRYWSLARTSQYAAGRDGSKVQPALPAPSGS